MTDSSLSEIFRAADYQDAYQRYFKCFVEAGCESMDPSGWRQTDANLNTVFDIGLIHSKNLSRYLIDSKMAIPDFKSKMIKLLSAWDVAQYSVNCITVFPSVSASTLAVCYLLKKKDVSLVQVETPAYFSVFEQLSMAGIPWVRRPCFAREQYEVDFTPPTTHCPPQAIWVTQPRFGLGSNQEREKINLIVNLLRPKDYLIVDEAAEQYYPSILASVNFNSHRNIIKVRSPTKSLGLNAARIGLVLHHPTHQEILSSLLWHVGGALDHLSVEIGSAITQNGNGFPILLEGARKKVQTTVSRLRVATTGGLLSLPSAENGYISSVRYMYTKVSADIHKAQKFIYTSCARRKIPVILGQNMHFAHDESYDHIRLNLYTSQNHLIDFLLFIDRIIRPGHLE